ncbi:MAG TPA: GAF domain-containing sensor histidine kinase [Conexibacter sp.]|nr:GAF domain-containing sensor histidine kinase [Conexibacter sp.]
MNGVLDQARLERLMAVGTTLVSQLELDTLLTNLLEVAQELTGARYAALAVLDEERREIERFLTRGIDPAAHSAIGDPPRGRGILGALIEDPRPLRLHDVREDPRSYGFPSEHPPMRSFLGVPILIRGLAWGNLYLTDKTGGDFDAADEQTVTTLAAWAAIAVEHADLYRRLRERGNRLERTVRSFEATTTITRAVGAETRIDRVLELIVKRGRALVNARALLILLQDGDGLQIAAGAGDVDPDAIGRRIPVRGTTAAAVLRAVQSERIPDVESRLRVSSERLGVPVTANGLGVHDPQAALLVPLEFRSRKLGVLIAFDRAGSEAMSFDRDQQALLLAFAASAATAVATAQSAERQRRRERMAAAERERQRWAHELHDQTLQSLASFRVLIDTALEDGAPARSEQTLRTLAGRIDGEIAQLRALITELRPAALDEQGLQPAIEHLAEQVASTQGIAVETEVSLDAPGGGSPKPLAADTETAIYRVVQEALTNAVKHAGASHVRIGVRPRDGGVDVTITDDGAGFDPDTPREGFGISGMHERAELGNGTLAITSRPGAGTTVHVWLHADEPATTSA